MTDSHFHFIVWAAEGHTGGQYSGVTYVDVVSNSMNAAIEKAKKLIPNRNYYWVNNVVEHHAHEGE